MSDSLKPPYSNTGVLPTIENDLVPCVDWVQVTFKSVQKEQVLTEVLQLPESLFLEIDHGQYMYTRQIRFGDIVVLYDGMTDGMGVHLKMSGQGCRQLDYYLKNQGRTWKDFFNSCFSFDVNFTRLDVSIDDFKGYFKISNLVKKVKKDEVVSKFRSAYQIEKMKIDGGVSQGISVYFGSPSSKVRFRFYEKNYEQADKRKVDVEEIGFWNRYECQLRDSNATRCAEELAKSHDISYVIRSVMNNYIRFVVKDDKDSNKWRWQVWRPWKKFIDDCEKLSLYVKPELKSIGDIKKWLEKSVSPSLALIDFVSDEMGTDLIDELINIGKEKLTDKHILVLREFFGEKINN